MDRSEIEETFRKALEREDETERALDAAIARATAAKAERLRATADLWKANGMTDRRVRFLHRQADYPENGPAIGRKPNAYRILEARWWKRADFWPSVAVYALLLAFVPVSVIVPAFRP